MADFSAESLSALMDSEAEEMEVRRLLAQAETDGEIRARWLRYHAARSVMQKDDEVHYAHIDISKRVWEQIASEPAHQPAKHTKAAEQQATRPAFFSVKPLTGFAVAASVAAVVFFGVQGLNSSAPSATGNLAGNMPQSGGQLPPLEQVATTARNSKSIDEGRVAAAKFEAEQRLRMQTYLQLHAQQASVNGSQGILPLAHAAKHEVK